MKTDLNWKLEKKVRAASKEEVLSHVELLISDVEIAVLLFSKSLYNLIILRTATQKLQPSTYFTLTTS